MTAKESPAPSEYSLLTNNRFWFLCASGLLAAIVLASVWTLIPAGELRIIRLQQAYGLIGTVYLYFAVLATPLTKVFPGIRGRSTYLHLRRAIGVSAFGFSFLHVVIAFFGQLGGFSGVGFLSSRYILALTLGVLGLIVLGSMAATSFDKVIDRMGIRNWKRLHRLVYIAGLAILVHIVMLGTHYAYGSSIFARITLAAMLFLLLLEAIRVDRWLKQRIKALQHFGVASMIILHIVFLGVGFILGKSGAEVENVRVHGGHGQKGNVEKEAYIKFEPEASAGDQTVRISSEKISFRKLISGGEVVEFRSKPGFTDSKSVSCFLVNQQSYAYYQGLAKIKDTTNTNPNTDESTTIQCLPIGDDGPPKAGHYTLYLRIERPGAIDTLPFNLEVTDDR